MRKLSTPALAVLTLPLSLILTLISGADADPGVVLESDNETVVKIEYLGSGTDNEPILSVTGGKSFGAKVEGTWRGLTGKVPGYAEPYPSLPAGIAAAGPIGITAYGTNSSGTAIGAHIMSNASYTYGINYGVEVRARYGYNVYGVYAEGYGGTNQTWAGYFSGNTYSTGTYQGSDRMFKKNVQDFTGGLDKVMLLNPKSYDMKTEEFKNDVDLPKGRQVGLIAQELQEVIPELVTDVQAPPRLTDEEIAAGVQKEGLKFKAVNYTGLIPVLIAAIQEQQALIEALQAKVATLKR